MPGRERRSHPRYPIWLPITVRAAGSDSRMPAMLCDISEGGALVWGYWSNPNAGIDTIFLHVAGKEITLDCDVVGVERLWDTVVLHLRFLSREQVNAADIPAAIEELRAQFRQYQRYLAFRADDDPGLGRTTTQYPGDRASA